MPVIAEEVRDGDEDRPTDLFDISFHPEHSASRHPVPFRLSRSTDLDHEYEPKGPTLTQLQRTEYDL
uniref:Uncharacterized protein n=1 Tax=Daphnia galeata TaxID=27404 RepID=A0A8J2RPH5_9CRUS|nr:unnamed protein product [Daphnia galeata]